MSGTQILSGGVGLGGASAGSGWLAVLHGQAGRSLGELPVYPAVAKLQRVINGIQAASAGNPTMIPFREGRGRIGEDGRYGNETNQAAMALADWLVRQGWCSRTSGAEINRNGPNAMRDCLTALTGVNQFSSGEVDELQRAWNDWVAATPPPAGETAAARLARLQRECAAAGGTWNTARGVCNPGKVEPEGMGTGMWILLALLGAALAYGIYWISTE